MQVKTPASFPPTKASVNKQAQGGVQTWGYWQQEIYEKNLTISHCHLMLFRRSFVHFFWSELQTGSSPSSLSFRHFGHLIVLSQAHHSRPVEGKARTECGRDICQSVEV